VGKVKHVRNTALILILYLAVTCLSCTGAGKMHIVTRDEWGSQPVVEAETEHQIKYITIHHGGVFVAPDKDPKVYLQDLQEWCRTEKNWTDIPYHFLMDLEGRVYEGRPVRYPGDTNTAYDPTGHLLICVIGNYEEQVFTDVQYDALVGLLAHFCEIYRIDPALIRGHKDYTETACPGKNIYRHISSGQLISDVTEHLRIKN
jgi:hypothetical protein